MKIDKSVAININSTNVEKYIKKEMIKFYKQLNKKYKRINIVCIGSDRATGDCLGPLVGTFLEKKIRNNHLVRIYGTLDSPVHAKNIEDIVTSVKDEDSLMIAVDASLGRPESIGNIMVYNHPIKPGAGVGKDIIPVGDLSIIGIVNYMGYFDHMLLQTTRLSIVYNLSEVIAKGLKSTITVLQKDLLIDEVLDEVAVAD